jgi:hypothetical protein
MSERSNYDGKRRRRGGKGAEGIERLYDPHPLGIEKGHSCIE